MSGQINIHKRTFGEFFQRDNELAFRKLKVTSKWIIFSQFHPFKSLFVYKKFKRVANGLQKQIDDNRQAGYWI